EDRLNSCRAHLVNAVNGKEVKELGNTVDLPKERCYVGLDAAEKLINSQDVNYVILATPPGFRPGHIQATVAAGKSLFTEKPIAADASGVRKVLDAYEAAMKKGLHIVAGTQRRHQGPYLETVKRLHDGAIGDIVAGHCHWNQNNIWFRKRKEGMTD